MDKAYIKRIVNIHDHVKIDNIDSRDIATCLLLNGYDKSVLDIRHKPYVENLFMRNKKLYIAGIKSKIRYNYKYVFNEIIGSIDNLLNNRAMLLYMPNKDDMEYILSNYLIPWRNNPSLSNEEKIRYIQDIYDRLFYSHLVRPKPIDPQMNRNLFVLYVKYLQTWKTILTGDDITIVLNESIHNNKFEEYIRVLNKLINSLIGIGNIESLHKNRCDNDFGIILAIIQNELSLNDIIQLHQY
jgi:hypothetical protein